MELVRWQDPSGAFLLLSEKEQGRAEQEFHFHSPLVMTQLIRPASKLPEKTCFVLHCNGGTSGEFVNAIRKFSERSPSPYCFVNIF